MSVQLSFMCPTETFLEAINKINGAISTQDLAAAVKGLHLTLEGNSLRLCSTNYVLTEVVTIDVDKETEGTAVIPFGNTRKILQEADGTRVRITVEDDVATIRCGYNVTALRCPPAAGFPSVPLFDSTKEALKLSRIDFLRALGQVAPFVSRQESMIRFNQLLIANEQLVACDSAALAIVDYPGLKIKVQLPFQAISELNKILNNEPDESFEMQLTNKTLLIKVGAATFASVIVATQFGDLKQALIAPTEANTVTATFVASELSGALRRVATTADPKNATVGLKFLEADKQCLLSAFSSEGHSSQEPISATIEGIEGDNYEIFVLAPHLLEMVRACGQETLTVNFGARAASGRVPPYFIRVDTEYGGVFRCYAAAYGQGSSKEAAEATEARGEEVPA